ncbi:GEM-like protein 7 [Hibiscus syriacus]|uniref:GEM-like protein 7 n=1 Tax=Hibiscus syriacus TaxID=106335 RepID=A0A6A2YFZ2_HIBSY|nr:GEM-like protein 7 [Hibiscus syriacus]
MKNQLLEQVIGVPINRTSYEVERTSRLCLPDASGQCHISSQGSIKRKGNFVLKRMNLLVKKADTFAHGIREHVRLGPKISETLKGKLSLGARILQIKGVNQSENMKKPSEKYMEIVTVDGFDTWFMGFLDYKKAFKYLQQATSHRLDEVEVTF